MLLNSTSNPTWDQRRYRWNPYHLEPEVHIHAIESIPLETSYEAVANHLWRVAERTNAAEIWIDGTGVGIAVEEIIRKARPASARCSLIPVTITASGKLSRTSVPRLELLNRLAIELERRSVKVAPNLTNWPALRKELISLDSSGHKTQSPDDLALALALAIWATAGAPSPAGERAEGRLLLPIAVPALISQTMKS